MCTAFIYTDVCMFVRVSVHALNEYSMPSNQLAVNKAHAAKAVAETAAASFDPLFQLLMGVTEPASSQSVSQSEP